MNPRLMSSPTFWIRLVSAAVVVSLGLHLAHLTWRLVGWDDGRTSVYTPDRLTPVGGAIANGVDAILALAPFGGGAAGADGLPASTLGLVLKGIIYSGNPDASTAMIASGSGTAQSFSVGQAPVGNALIAAIEMDRVVLSVGGRREVLTFPKPSASAPVGQASQPGQGLSTGPATPLMDPAAASALAAASPVATALAAQEARKAAPNRPTAAANRVDPAAALAAADVSVSSAGYRVGPNPPPQLLRAGLKPGDLIRTLNGRPVSDLNSDRQLFERAAGAGSARVEIVRDGRPLTLTFPLR